ncbi:MAG TPA: peroxidase-related enzyme [Candidatus Dormibacteraeota bacterium]|jgi:uncharacterized peroxidase-related enzyme
MSRILALSLETAEGPQRAILEKTRAEVGYISGTRRLLLVDPQVGQPGRQLYEYLNLRADSPFSRLQREMVATVVYGMVGAKPCLSAHCEAMRRLTADDDFGPQFVEKWPDYPMDAQTLALLTYARRLTGWPDRITDQDIESLKGAGWDERAIYEATALIALFNFIGRIEAASGLPMDEIPASADIPEARADGRSGGLLVAK